MAALSVLQGRPLAMEMKRVLLGEGKEEYVPTGQIIHLLDEKDLSDTGGISDPIDILGEDYFRALRKTGNKKLSVADYAMLIDCLKSGELPDDENLHEVFHDSLDKYHNQEKLEIVCEGENILFPVFNPDVDRETPYLAAPSGAGKSTWIARYCLSKLKVDPEAKIFLFSRVAEDPALDMLKPTRYPIDDELVKTPPEIKTFENCVVIFDDIDTIPSKKQADCVQKLRDDLLETGRHEKVTVISTSHQLMNYKKTRTLLNEASCVTFFPGSGTYHIIEYLKRYGGLPKKVIDKILGLKSRWITHHRGHPQCFVHERGAFMPDVGVVPAKK
jgi:hypothetical protein